jgi:hypothetical protein
LVNFGLGREEWLGIFIVGSDKASMCLLVRNQQGSIPMDQPQLGHFGNRRLAAVGDSLLGAMEKQRTMPLQALAESRSQARQFQHFLDNEAVSMHEICGVCRQADRPASRASREAIDR